jgi:hypothetical protein
MEYRHTQVGWIIIAAAAGVAALTLLPLSGAPLPSPVLRAVLPLLLVVLGLFCALTVEISGGALVCRFGPGLIRRRIALAEIVEARSVRNAWHDGWGIRWRPGEYVLWNVSGLEAVELLLAGGRRFRIGTDEPQALVQAILAGRMHQSPIERSNT